MSERPKNPSIPERDLRAVVLVWTLDEQALGQPFDGPDCLERAHDFAEYLRERGDFPGALITVTGTPAASHECMEKLLVGRLSAPEAGERDGRAEVREGTSLLRRP